MKQTHFETLAKAGDATVWYNFMHQHDADFMPIVVVHGPEDDFVLLEKSEAEDMEIPVLEMPTDYSKMTYPHIKSIRSDYDPLKHWEEIMGMISTMPLDYLRFILECKVPLETIIKYELAARGINKKGKWIGFDQAERLWFGNSHY